MNHPHLISRRLALRPRAFARRGLAPLELVLWLPILLFVAALMVNLGTMTTWRIRGEVVAREAVWRSRYPRSGANEPRPIEKVWPADAAISVRSGANIDKLDVAAMQHRVIRGELPAGFEVNQIFDPKPGVREGVSSITRNFPLLGKLGPYQSGEIVHPMLDNGWQNIPLGVPSNVYRRIKIIYKLPQTDQSLANAYTQAIRDILGMPKYRALRVLDRDEEIRHLTGGYHDFHPRVNSGYCELDRETVEKSTIKNPNNPLVDLKAETDNRNRLGQISHLPNTMNTFFWNMYRSAIRRLEAQIDALKEEQKTATPERKAQIPGEIAAAQAEIDRIKPLIPPHEAYEQQIPQIEAELKQKVP